VAKPVQLRRVAADDIDAALEYHLHEAGADVARRFLSAVERTLVAIGRTARSGSLRFAYELEIPDLRCWPLTRYPHLVFYVEHADHVDVWRLLHTRRDIPTTLADTSDE
jgi:toxin ParE1/3/4